MEVGKEKVIDNEERLHKLENRLSAFQKLIEAVKRGQVEAHGNAE